MSNVVVADEVIAKEVDVDEMVVDEVDTKVVQPDVIVVDLVPYVIADTKVTSPSTEPSMHTNRGFPGGSIDRLVLTEYVGHVALRL